MKFYLKSILHSENLHLAWQIHRRWIKSFFPTEVELALLKIWQLKYETGQHKKDSKKEEEQNKESETGSFVMEYFAADHQTRS